MVWLQRWNDVWVYEDQNGRYSAQAAVCCGASQYETLLYLKYFAALLLFDSNGVAASFIYLSSYEIVLLCSALGSVLLLRLFFATGHHVTLFRHKRDSLFVLLSTVAYVILVLSNKLAKEIGGTENAAVQLLCTARVVIVFAGWKKGAMDVTPDERFPVLQLGLLNTGGRLLATFPRPKSCRHSR